MKFASNLLSKQQAIGVLQEDMSGNTESDCVENPQNTRRENEDEPLLLLADTALALPCGDQVICSSQESRHEEENVQFVKLELQFLMRKADDLQACLVSGQGEIERGTLAAAVRSFLRSCQPFFTHLESTARGNMAQLTHLPFEIYTSCVQMLDFSQQLCDRLEQLVLTYSTYNLFSLDESDPYGVSHFCVGQTAHGRLRLTTFCYCRPTPYLAQVDTGLYKRVRWNVDRLRDDHQHQLMFEEQDGESDEMEAGTVSDTEYYFLCCEDVHSVDVEADWNTSYGTVARLWSIGQWIQEIPDPDTEDINDWIMCEVPRGKYHKLLVLGHEEPSCSRATDSMQNLLMSWQATERCLELQD